MSRTLYELFMSCYFEATLVPWRIYGKGNKIICKNYGDETSDKFDNLQVKSYGYSKNRNFIRVYVEQNQ